MGSLKDLALAEFKLRPVREIFTAIYEIPPYQRPYSWDKDQITELWNDLTEAFEEDSLNGYFLGAIVLCKKEKEDIYEVIDGQQRLTTLLLLMRAVIWKDYTHKHVERLIFVHDDATDEKTDQLRLVSNAIEDKNSIVLRNILSEDSGSILKLKEEKKRNKNKFLDNFFHFEKSIGEWRENKQAKLPDLIAYILNKVNFLEIKCSSEESALKIFQTINDRGLQLHDLDVLKAKIYEQLSGKQKEDFIQYWNSLREEDSKKKDLISWLFGVYAHAIGHTDDSISSGSKKLNLKKFFDEEIKKNSAENVIINLKKLHTIFNFQINDENKELKKWLLVLNNWPVELVIYPYYAYMYKYAEEHEGEIFLKKEDNENLIKILQELVRFITIKGIISKSRDAVKSIIFTVCSSITVESCSKQEVVEKIKNILKTENKENEKKMFEAALKDLKYKDRYLKPLLILYHTLNPKQMPIDYADYSVEHILPKDGTQNFDDWDRNSYEKYVDSLGNLILLEKVSNSKAQNEFLRKKQEKAYKNSKIIDVSDKESGLMSYSEWTPEESSIRFGKMKERLVEFLFSTF